MNDPIPGFQLTEGADFCRKYAVSKLFGSVWTGRWSLYSQLPHGFNWQTVNEIATWLTNQALVVQKVDDAMHWMNPVVRQYLLNIWILQW